MSPTLGLRLSDFIPNQAKMSRGGGGSDRVMRLNVGGSFYTTTKPTMQAVPGSVLQQIASGSQYCPRDDRGNYVIDRDGHTFRYVLNYLRSGKLVVPLGYRELDILREEAIYYGIEGLRDAVDHILETRRRRARGRRWNGAAKKLSASVGENLNNLVEDDEDLDFFEDSWIGGSSS